MSKECELCTEDEDCLVCQMAKSVENFERGRPTSQAGRKRLIDLKKGTLQIPQDDRML